MLDPPVNFYRIDDHFTRFHIPPASTHSFVHAQLPDPMHQPLMKEWSPSRPGIDQKILPNGPLTDAVTGIVLDPRGKFINFFFLTFYLGNAQGKQLVTVLIAADNSSYTTCVQPPSSHHSGV